MSRLKAQGGVLGYISAGDMQIRPNFSTPKSPIMPKKKNGPVSQNVTQKSSIIINVFLNL